MVTNHEFEFSGQRNRLEWLTTMVLIGLVGFLFIVAGVMVVQRTEARSRQVIENRSPPVLESELDVVGDL